MTEMFDQFLTKIARQLPHIVEGLYITPVVCVHELAKAVSRHAAVLHVFVNLCQPRPGGGFARAVECERRPRVAF